MSPPQLDLDACERRVYRLAVLLTGDRRTGAEVLEAVVRARPDLRMLDSAHMDRLTVLRAREAIAGGRAETVTRPPGARGAQGSMPPAAAAAALDGLSPQQREAWIFRRVYGLGPHETARAMDCSVTALAVHLDPADARMAEALGAALPDAAPAALAWSLSLEVPAVVRARRARRLRHRRLMHAVAWAVAIAGLLGLVWALRG